MIENSSELTEQIRQHFPAFDDPDKPIVIDGHGRHRPVAPVPQRGPLLKALYAVFHFFGYYPDVDPWIRKQWD